jgi:HK97 family phage major capsid protein
MGKYFKYDEDKEVMVELSDEEVQKLNSKEAPVKDEVKGAIDELAGVVKDLATKTGATENSIKEKQEELEKEVAAYKEAVAKGFPLPGSEILEVTTEDEFKEICAPYDLARQGQALTNRLTSKRVVNDETRLEIAKFFCTFLKAAYMQDPAARKHFIKHYGPIKTDPAVQAHSKTAIGDTGNIFPLPEPLEAEVIWFMRESSVIMQYARQYPMIAEKERFPRETSSATVTWGNTTAQSDPGIEEFDLDCTELSAYSAVRNTQLADARTDIVAWLTANMAEAAGQELDNKAWNGLGTDDPFICSGILSTACGYSVSMTSGSTAFSTLYADVLSEMIGKLNGKRKDGARFCMDGAILHYVRVLKDSQDRPIFYDGSVGVGTPAQIYGYPYTEVIAMPSTSGAATAFISFGNLQYFAIGNRLDTTALQVDPYGLWTTNRTRFKIYQRWALEMALPEGFVRLLTAAS